ncbi:MAG: chemotaxis protein CheX [Planctomycetota bacterium]
MSDSLKDLVERTLIEILEETAMIFADPASPEGIEGPPGDLVYATMEIEGHAYGSLNVIAPMDLVQAIAAGVLGVDEDSEQATENAFDAFAEFLNVTVGKITVEQFGSGATFDLKPPVTAASDTQRWQDILNSDDVVALDADDNLLLAYAVLNETVGEARS